MVLLNSIMRSSQGGARRRVSRFRALVWLVVHGSMAHLLAARRHTHLRLRGHVVHSHVSNPCPWFMQTTIAGLAIPPGLLGETPTRHETSRYRGTFMSAASEGQWLTQVGGQNLCDCVSQRQDFVTEFLGDHAATLRDARLGVQNCQR